MMRIRQSMKTAQWLGAAIALGGFILAAHSQVPQIISYQGTISAAGSNFNGLGQFKFALVNSNGTASFWSNDGSSAGGSEPILTVTNLVSQGLFFVMLGDSSVTDMTPIPWSVFTNSDVRLRIWFGAGTNPPVLLTPDQRLSSVGFAMMAANLPNGAVTSAQLASNAVTTQSITNGAITSVQLGINSVTTPAIFNGSVTAAKLAPQAVTTPALAEGAVTAAILGPQAVTSSALAAGSVTTTAIANGAVGLSQVNFQLGYINAQNPPYGATGNGTNDDSAAIQAALNAVGGNGGGVVFLPRGNYLISSNLVVPAETSLVGVWRSPTAWSQYLGTTLLAVAGAGETSGVPFITLQGPNSVLDGVTIYYPNQVMNNPPTPYPWTIQAGGGDIGMVVDAKLAEAHREASGGELRIMSSQHLAQVRRLHLHERSSLEDGDHIAKVFPLLIPGDLIGVIQQGRPAHGHIPASLPCLLEHLVHAAERRDLLVVHNTRGHNILWWNLQGDKPDAEVACVEWVVRAVILFGGDDAHGYLSSIASRIRSLVRKLSRRVVSR